MAEITDYLFEQLDIYGCRNIRRNGDNIRCTCPFHGGNNSSAFSMSVVQEEYGYPYHCFNCHASGNIYTLIAHLNNCSFKKAKKLINKNVAIAAVNIDNLTKLFEKMQTVDSNIKKYIEPEVPNESSNKKPMIKYLNKRKRKQHGVIDVDYIVKKYDLYFCDSGRYRNRIIMPIRSLDGTYIQFNDRSIHDDAANKSLHQSGTNFNDVVHGVYESLGKSKVILVEGAFDMFQLICFMRNKKKYEDYGVVALMNTLVTEERAATISSMFEEAVILFDHDEAGLNGSELASDILLDQMPVQVITDCIPKHKDPAICNSEQLQKALRYVVKPKVKYRFAEKFYDMLG